MTYSTRDKVKVTASLGVDNGDDPKGGAGVQNSSTTPTFQGFSRISLHVVYKLIGFKVGYLALIFFLLSFYGNSRPGWADANLRWPKDSEPTFATHLATWDAAHYLLISERGYEKGSPSCAFYPLLPLMIRGLSLFTFHNHLIAGLILCNVLSIAGISLFHFFVAHNYQQRTANTAVLLLLAFPGALFFSFVYTESLFFLLIVLLFLFLRSQNYLGVAVVACLIPLTKALGLLCVVPVLLHLFIHKRQLSAYLSCLGFFLGSALYFLFFYLATGNPLEGFEAQKFYPTHPSIRNIFDLSGLCQALFTPLQVHGMLDSGIDRWFFFMMLLSLPWVYRLSKVYFVFVLVFGFVPALSAWFVSYTRYVMMCFPLFIVLAKMVEGEESEMQRWGIVMIFGAIQVSFLLHHINFYWAG